MSIIDLIGNSNYKNSLMNEFRIKTAFDYDVILQYRNTYVCC